MKNNFIKLAFFAFALFFFVQKGMAQDPRFSQFNSAPWAVNPALTGVFNGKYRLAANYRDQWSSVLGSNPFRTYDVSGDVRFPVGRTNYLAAGGGLLRDEAGLSNFTQTRFNLGVSYLLQISGASRYSRNSANHFLVAGLQAGFGQNTIDFSKLWFSNQFDPLGETVNTTLPTGEQNEVNKTKLFPDINAGLLWYALFGDNKYVYAGAAMHHANSPAASFINNKSIKIDRRWTGHVGAQLPLNQQLSLMPGLLVMKQGPAFETTAGTMIRYSNGDRNELALRAGVFGRVGKKLDKGSATDALIFVAMLEIQTWTLGLSYDVNVSTLKRASNSRGAFELSLIYTHEEHRRQHVVCPKL